MSKKLQHTPKTSRSGGFGVAIFAFIFGLIYKIPMVKKLTLFTKKTALNYLQKQLKTNQNQSTNTAKLTQWADRQWLQLDIDAAGDGEPIENYFSNEQTVDEEEIPEKPLGYKSRFKVTTTANHLSVTSPDNPVQTISWSKVTEINIYVEDPNPTDSEAWIVIITDDQVASFPEWVTGQEQAKKNVCLC